jgi:hypothetical protein
MSGLVITTAVRSRAARRASPGVSPSYTTAGTLRPASLASSRMPASWSRLSAFVGYRYRAVDSGSFASASRTGRWKHRLLPLAVGVDTTT